MTELLATSKRPIWLWPNLLSLDAPFVALAWQAFLASCYSLPLRAGARVALGLTVWGIYLADRILDVRYAPSPRESARHAFSRQHLRLMVGLLLAVVVADALCALVWLRPAVLIDGFVPLAGVLLYFAVLHASGPRLRLPKEVAIAVLFTCGTFLAGWANSARPTHLIAPALAFAVLCLQNLVTIEMWEWRELRSGCASPPHPWTKWLGATYYYWAVALTIACLVLGGTRWYGVIAAAAILTAVLDVFRRRIPLNARRATIDLIMLAPLLFLF